MLSRRRCPFTGVINFYANDDPYMSVGSIAKSAALGGYYWHCYAADDRVLGVTSNLKAAERAFANHYRKALDDQRASAVRLGCAA